MSEILEFFLRLMSLRVEANLGLMFGYNRNWFQILIVTVRRHKETTQENKVSLCSCYESKFDCLVYEMLFIKERKPSLNVQSDSLKAKLF